MKFYNSKMAIPNLDSTSSKLKNVINVCHQSKDLNIALYHVDQEHFFYFNKAFKTFSYIKDKALLQNGWDSWFMAIDSKESPFVQRQIAELFSADRHKNTITLKYHMPHGKERRCVKHEISLYFVEGKTLAINYFFDISDQEKIAACLKNNNTTHSNATSKQTISPREIQVLQLIADGFSSKQIANQLFISNHTAISHRKHLIQKFQVKNTAQLIKKASRVIEL